MSDERLRHASEGELETPQPPTRRAQLTGEPANIKREIVLTLTAEETVSKATSLIRRKTGAKPTDSHFVRALLSVAESAMDQFESELEALGPLSRPSNARGKERDLEAFEQKISDALRAAIRKSSGR